MAGADEENYLDNQLNSTGEESESPANDENTDTYNNTSTVTQNEEDMSLDLSEPELSKSDLERLESMKLDSIIEQATSNDISVEELLNDDIVNGSKEAKTNGNDMNQSNNENVSEASDKSAKNVKSNDGNDIQAYIMDDANNKGKKRKKKKKDKKGLIAALKNIFFEDIDEEVKASVEGVNADAGSDDGKKKKKDKKSKKETKQNQQHKEANAATDLENNADKPLDENQQLLDEMYGDKDHLDENIAPKKGLFAKIRYRLQQYKQKNEEEERLEEEAEVKDQEEKKKLKEENAKKKADKKEEAKKAKEEKAKEAKEAKAQKPKKEKPKKEKKPKPEPKPGDILKIKPKSMILFILFIASVLVLMILFNIVFNYNKDVSEAKGYIESENYAKAYQKLAGLSLRKNDEALLRQVSVIMFVQRQTESYNHYMQLEMKDQALNALVKGLERYNEYYREAQELGITPHLDVEKEKILEYFKNTYNMTEEDANRLVQLKETDFVSYYASLVKYRKAKA